MKYANIIVFAIVAAAALVAAYAIGLLVRQARMRPGPAHHQVAVAANDVTTAEARPEGYGPGRGRRFLEDPPPETAEERAEMLEQMSNLTEEEQEQFRQQVRERFGPGGRQTQADELGAKRRAQMVEKWQSMSEEEKEAFKTQMLARMRARRQSQLQAAPTEAVDANAATEPPVQASSPDPNEGNQP